MKHYYINRIAQKNGDNEVHSDGCKHLPGATNRAYLGIYTNCKDAVTLAKITYPKANGCSHCCNDCHTS